MDLRQGLRRRNWRVQGQQWNQHGGTEKECAFWCETLLIFVVVMEVVMGLMVMGMVMGF